METKIYINFHQNDGLVVEFKAYADEMKIFISPYNGSNIQQYSNNLTKIIRTNIHYLYSKRQCDDSNFLTRLVINSPGSLKPKFYWQAIIIGKLFVLNDEIISADILYVMTHVAAHAQ